LDAGSGTSDVTGQPWNVTGLTPGTTYYYRVCGKNAATGTEQVCGAVMAFMTTGAPTVPAASTGPATAITNTGAALSGTINAHGATTAYTFEYGTGLTFGNVATVENGGSSTADEPVTGTLSGLSPNTTYFYRLVATNSQGTTNGPVMSFTTMGPPTAPAVTDGAATNVTSTSAVLHGTVNPQAQPTSFVFEYGVGTSLNQVTTTDNAGSFGGVEDVSLPTGTLSPATNYCFRLVATNPIGTTAATPLQCFRTA
jgi:phosphodiesterase/alkaline phosphatase D-like protein